MKTFDFTAANGVPFTVVFEDAKEGEPSSKYGPTVAFYDRRHKHTEHGQFTGGRYYAITLLDDEDRITAHGLTLYGGVADWSVDGPTIGDVFDWIVNQLPMDEMDFSITYHHTGS